ncbi:arabinosyltransferase C-terminal domain-containing protein [Corynebacterium bovis]|uniref:arabinosyltransferase C-terminal domain-containing protein n=1 Tax=Corynebacterium bovis TaxID=36808 RepID=UPI000F651ACA
MTTRSEELPTYLVDDWQRDWGVLDKLTPFPNGQDETPKPVTLGVTARPAAPLSRGRPAAGGGPPTPRRGPAHRGPPPPTG